MDRITDELIRKFLSNRCTPSEAERVAAYFEKYPDKLEAWLPETEWEMADGDYPLEPDVSVRMLEVVRQRAGLPTVRRAWLRLGWLGSAAAVLLVGTDVWLLTPSRSGSGAGKTESVAEELNTGAPELVKTNTGETPIDLKLSDGSLVTLYPASELKFKELFDAHKREIELRGAARFDVKPDPRRPFTVLAGATSTTVLGTIFRITDYDHTTKTAVELISGSIRVLPDRFAAAADEKALYPEPGGAVWLDKNTGLAELRPPVQSSEQELPDPVEKEVNVTWVWDDAVVGFNNTPVLQVFAVLEERLGVRITYDRKLVRNMYFTGSFRNHAGLAEEVVATIGVLNQLKVEKTDQGFTISK